jgi:serine/threonine protein kinase
VNTMSQSTTPEPDRNLPEIENLELIELLGRGGMSLVYKARQTMMDRIVVVKVLINLTVLDETSARRFHQEARLSGRLDHPNIARTLAFGISKSGQPYLVMEYLDGITLAGELKKDGRLTLRKFRDVFLPVLSALCHAHQAGVVHRDIKPANIMLCRRQEGGSQVKLLDFGIAKMVEGVGESQKLTGTGTILGTPSYMSPEQCLGREVDFRSDLYSLACVMYESLCGKPPFDGDSALEVMNGHAALPPPTVAELCGRLELDRALAAAILLGLSKNPFERPQSADAFADKLREILDGLDLDSLPIPRADSTPAKAFPVALFYLILAAVAALSGLFWKPWQKREPPVASATLIEHAHLSTHPHSARLELHSIQPLSEENVARGFIQEAFRLQKTACRAGILPETRSEAIEQAKHYSDGAIEHAERSGNPELFLDACKQRLDDLREVSSKRLLALIKTTDKLYGGKPTCAALVFRTECIATILRAQQTDGFEPLLQETIRLAEENCGTENFVSFASRAELAQLRALQGKFSESDAICREVANDLNECEDLDAGNRGGNLLCGQILKTLELTGNAELAQNIVDKELSRHQKDYKDQLWLVGTMHMCLGDVQKAGGHIEKAIAEYSCALPYFRKFNKIPEVHDCLSDLVNLCRTQGLTAKLADYERQLAELNRKK